MTGVQTCALPICISTYIWIVTNRKERNRKGKVQLVNAVDFYRKMRKSLGNKRNEIDKEQIAEITRIYGEFTEGEHSKIFDNDDFGFRKITVERPLRLSFAVTPERIEALKLSRAFENLATSKKKGKECAAEVEAGLQLQRDLVTCLRAMPDNIVWKSCPEFECALDEALDANGVHIPSPLRKAVIAALGERDETAEICLDAEGNPEPDPDIRDTESVPLKEDVQAYFKREVQPHVPDAWIDESKTMVGYEIPFTRQFYKYVPPRPIEEIEAENERLLDLLSQRKRSITLRFVTGSQCPRPKRQPADSRLPPVPGHWATEKLGYLARLVSGGTPSKENSSFWEGEIPWVSPKDMKTPYLHDSEDHISTKAIRAASLEVLPPSTVLIVVRGMILVHSLPVGILRVPATINQDIKGLCFNSRCDPEFMLAWLQGIAYLLHSLVEESAHGTRCLRTDLLKNIVCHLPPLEEQRQIAADLSANLATLDEVSRPITAAIALLREYRAALISAAVTGQLDLRQHEKQ